MTALLPLLRFIAPYLIAAGVGFSGAWYVQGVRLDAAHNEFAAYKTEQQRLINEATAKADKQREESADEYRKNVAKLKADGEVFRRCVAAGKCGGLSGVPGGSGIKLSASGGIDATGTDTIPAAGGSTPQVLIDCAATTLQLNSLQSDIEKQSEK